MAVQIATVITSTAAAYAAISICRVLTNTIIASMDTKDATPIISPVGMPQTHRGFNLSYHVRLAWHSATWNNSNVSRRDILYSHARLLVSSAGIDVTIPATTNT